MVRIPDTLRKVVQAIFVMIALLILVDFLMPGNIRIDDIIEIKRQRQQYYNAARNSHNSYKLITQNHRFHVAREFALSARGHHKVRYSVSPIFQEVNGYGLPPSKRRSTYSLRWASGLIIPLAALMALVFSYRSKVKIGIVLFVMKALLLADLIFLLL